MPEETITGSVNEIVNRVAGEILDNNLIQSASDAVTTFVTSSFKVAEDALKSVQNITQPPTP